MQMQLNIWICELNRFKNALPENVNGGLKIIGANIFREQKFKLPLNENSRSIDLNKRWCYCCWWWWLRRQWLQCSIIYYYYYCYLKKMYVEFEHGVKTVKASSIIKYLSVKVFIARVCRLMIDSNEYK